MAGASSPATAVIGTVVQRKNRHESDILEAPRYKPLGLVSGFVPSKTCREYVEQDCAWALPSFRPHAAALVQAGREVKAIVLPVGEFKRGGGRGEPSPYQGLPASSQVIQGADLLGLQRRKPWLV